MTLSREGNFWRRLFAFMRGTPALPATAESTDARPPEPAVLRSQHEIWLSRLAEDVAEGKRSGEIGDEEFWTQVSGLWDHGHERLAAQWVEKFIALPGAHQRQVSHLRQRLVEMHEQRGDLGTVLEHLETLAQTDDHYLRAHYLLGEHHRRRGDEATALRHYEAVLAREIDYPNVRMRVARLRAQRGQIGAPAHGETIVGSEGSAPPGSRYLLVRELGRGASGVVYLARDAQLERDVAIKLLHPHLAAAHRAAACARFFAEARIAASLRHPNILGILDLDEKARRIVMELAAGGTLRDVLRDRGAQTPRRALERHTQLLSALVAAHHRHIVHRDIKPANLMFRRHPNAPGVEMVLGDFGVAHLPEPENSEAKREDGRKSAIGTLAYMAPEQLRGERADPRWDVYAAAVVLFEMLAGRLPWGRAQALSGARSAQDLDPPAEVKACMTPELATELSRHLRAIAEPDPTQRPSSREALAAASELRDMAIAYEG
jgi:hypothetical protein